MRHSAVSGLSSALSCHAGGAPRDGSTLLEPCPDELQVRLRLIQAQKEGAPAPRQPQPRMPPRSLRARLLYPLTFRAGLAVLEGALAIGRQADVLGLDTVETRMRAVQSQAMTAPSAPGSPLLSKLKSWFGAAKQKIGRASCRERV